jgi:[amino group carrier protein]-lysine/ornithine hydrolase
MRPWAERAEIDGAGNAVGWFGTGHRRVVALGHIDTAPGWWPVTREGHVVHGRGSVDAKGSLCALLCAAARLPTALRARLTVQVIGAVEEERASSRGARHALEAYPRPDLVIVGEPSGWDAFTLGYKGRLVAEIVVERPEGHSAAEEASAAAVAALAWRTLESWAEGASAGAVGAFDAVQATLLGIASASDGLRQRAFARVAFRLPLGLDPADAAERIESTLAPLVARTGAVVRVGEGERAYRGPRDGPLARALRVAIRAEGGVPRPLLKTGTSDMNVVAPTWDVPMVAYGPGDASLDHTPHERIDLREYVRSIRVLERVFAALAT